MATVFIAGSISISHLHEKVQERITKIVLSEFHVVVGDADGADTSIQRCLQASQARRVTVYCTGEKPRNNVADWPVHHVHSKAKAGSRAYFTAKDLEMARKSDYGLMIWDSKSPGTLSNVIELLKENKKSVVFVNKSKDFVTVADRKGLDHLLTLMSDHARSKAEEKIGLGAKLAELDQPQLSLNISEEKATPEQKRDVASIFVSTGNEEGKSLRGESMKLRLALISALADHISRTHLNPSQAAKALGIAQRQLSDLTGGNAEMFGLDDLVEMVSMVGLQIEMRVQNPMNG